MGTKFSRWRPPNNRRHFVLCNTQKTTSVITVQRKFRRQFEVDPPDKNSIKRWHTQLMETGCLCKGKSIGRPSHSEETVDRVRQSFLRSPMKSLRKASRELALPRSTVWDVLHKRLKFKAYKKNFWKRYNIFHIFNGAVIWGNATQDGEFRVRFSYCPWKFSSNLFLLSSFSSRGVHSTSNTNQH